MQNEAAGALQPKTTHGQVPVPPVKQGDQTMIEVSVEGIAIDARNAQPIVILKDKETGTLPIWIGVAEARAISFALEKAKSDRPLTHELLLTTIGRLGYKLKQVEINRLGSSAYSATLKLSPLHAGNKRMMIDARPSDAIALALAAKAPIFAAPELVVVSTNSDQADAQAFKKFVDGLKASDFNLPGNALIAPIEDDKEDASLEAPTSSEAPTIETPSSEVTTFETPNSSEALTFETPNSSEAPNSSETPN